MSKTRYSLSITSIRTMQPEELAEHDIELEPGSKMPEMVIVERFPQWLLIGTIVGWFVSILIGGWLIFLFLPQYYDLLNDTIGLPLDEFLHDYLYRP